jgi:hypothetical protein
VAHLEVEGVAAVAGGVELGALLAGLGGLVDGAGVVHGELVAALGLDGVITALRLEVDVDLEVGGGGSREGAEEGTGLHWILWVTGYPCIRQAPASC